MTQNILQNPSTDFQYELVDSPDASTLTDNVEVFDAAALHANQHAEEAVEVGDYQAAAEWRQVAEDNASPEALEQLDGPDANSLDWAAWHQEQAQELEADQAQAAQSGDYESARELSQQAAAEHQEADALASGPDGNPNDHSYQDQLQAGEMDWAVWNQELADHESDMAVEAVESGDLDGAVYHAEQADDFQAEADYHGDLGEHGGDLSVWDPGSEVEDYSYDAYDSHDACDAYDAGTSVDDFSTV